MSLYGLIGKKLSHSFSKKHFVNKFQNQGIDSTYELFELNNIFDFDKLKEMKNLNGLNVTIPYKESIIPFLDDLDSIAKDIGAVNTIKFEKGKTIGFNSDYFGFKKSLQNFLKNRVIVKALILGNGGASKAVQKVLKDLNIDYTIVSRTKTKNHLFYDELSDEIIKNHHLIINTTSLGMSPDIDSCPQINYSAITNQHFCFDLIYNPEETLFMLKSKNNNASVINGFEMLQLQAEKSWKIWNS